MTESLKQSVPSSLALRDELETMVLNELLGPAGGPAEEIEEAPSTRYFVGVLAPRKRATSAAHPVVTGRLVPAFLDTEEEEPDDELLDGDELALGGRDTGQDGITDRAPAQDKALIPSSFGLTFCVNLDATALQVTASWGQYDRQPSAYLVSEKTGTPKRVWKRSPRGGMPYQCPLVDGPLVPIALDPQCPDVVVQGLMRRRETHWSVTLFLVNEQQEPERLRDTAWVFQPELAVAAPDGVPVFCNTHPQMALHNTDPLVKAEQDLLAMLYRHHVEFAVGHGVGVHADVSPDPTRAVRICTRVVPSASPQEFLCNHSSCAILGR